MISMMKVREMIIRRGICNGGVYHTNVVHPNFAARSPMNSIAPSWLLLRGKVKTKVVKKLYKQMNVSDVIQVEKDMVSAR